MVKRVLVPISFNFQVRYFVRTGLLRKLAEYCYPVVVLQWEQPDLVAELEAMGLRVYTMPGQKEGVDVVQLRKRIDAYFLEKIVRTPSAAVIRNHQYQLIRKFKKKIKHHVSRVKQRLYSERQFKRDTAALSTRVESGPAWTKVNVLMTEEKIDALFTTAPFLPEEDVWCRAAMKRDIPIFYGVLSFDNLTTRGYLPFVASRYAVWNQANKNQLIRTYGARVEPIIDVTGPPQFDFYFNRDYLLAKEAWLAEKRLPAGRPIILYGANAKYFVPDEFAVVRLLDEAISKGAVIGNPFILVRPHPTDSFSDWLEFIGTLNNAQIERSVEQNQSETEIYNKYSNFSISDVSSLCSSLAHTDVHISYFSTLALDGICFDKPIVCPYFSAEPDRLSHVDIRRLYETEHYQPITRSGAVMLPENEGQFIRAINQALRYPAELKEKRAQLKKDYLNDVKGNACALLLESFKTFLN